MRARFAVPQPERLERLQGLRGEPARLGPLNGRAAAEDVGEAEHGLSLPRGRPERGVGAPRALGERAGHGRIVHPRGAYSRHSSRAGPGCLRVELEQPAVGRNRISGAPAAILIAGEFHQRRLIVGTAPRRAPRTSARRSRAAGVPRPPRPGRTSTRPATRSGGAPPRDRRPRPRRRGRRSSARRALCHAAGSGWRGSSRAALRECVARRGEFAGVEGAEPFFECSGRFERLKACRAGRRRRPAASGCPAKRPSICAASDTISVAAASLVSDDSIGAVSRRPTAAPSAILHLGAGFPARRFVEQRRHDDGARATGRGHGPHGVLARQRRRRSAGTAAAAGSKCAVRPHPHIAPTPRARASAPA